MSTETISIKPEEAQGEAEHNQKMIEVAENANKPTESTEPPKEEFKLPEKFKSVEELYKSYAELEAKLGQPKQETQEETKTEDNTQQEVPDAYYQPFFEEYEKNGTLSEESLAKLQAEKGITREMYEAYAAGVKYRNEGYTEELLSTVGGKENYNVLSDWARNNLSKAELDAYNQSVQGSKEQATLALQGLEARYIKATGSKPKLLSGDPNVTSKANEYTSWAQVQADMGKKEYRNDPEFRNAVQNKLRNSNI